VRFVGLRVPLKTLAPLVANPSDAGMRVVPREARLSSFSTDIFRRSIWAPR
jgi:hypothetical protein